MHRGSCVLFCFQSKDQQHVSYESSKVIISHNELSSTCLLLLWLPSRSEQLPYREVCQQKQDARSDYPFLLRNQGFKRKDVYVSFLGERIFGVRRSTSDIKTLFDMTTLFKSLVLRFFLLFSLLWLDQGSKITKR